MIDANHKSLLWVSPMELQLSILERPEVEAAVSGLAESGAESRGAVFTRREVVRSGPRRFTETAALPLHRKAVA
jgi:hypothetical protein